MLADRLTAVPRHAAQARLEAVSLSWRSVAIWLGFLLLATPTVLANAHQYWASEQGEQAPIVLALGLWLLTRSWPSMRRAASPGRASWAICSFLVAGAIYLLGRVWTQFEVETYGLYALVIAGLFAMIGARGLIQGWFPLAYLTLSLPPPFTVTWFLTSHLRLVITKAAVALFQTVGFAVVRNGLDILIDQYDLAVRDACSGMNSLFSLSAVGLVYVYLRRGSRWWYLALMLPFVIFFAVFGNFTRVVALIALTHFFGDAAAQGILHQGTGFVTFLVALIGVVLVDAIAAPFSARLLRRGGG